MLIWQIFFQNSPHNGAINHFDSAVGNSILSLHYQVEGAET